MTSELRKKEAEKISEQIRLVEKQQRFIQGDYIGLRAVNEDDLFDLAALMAQSPLTGHEPQPWTEQRLKKEFDDEKDPGMWSEDKRTYLAVDGDGRIVGFIRQQKRGVNGHVFYLHVDDKHPQRDAAGRELVSLYMRLMADWADPPREEVFLLAPEEQKAGWLAASGFELECTFEEMYMYLGEPTAMQIWGWVSPRVLAQAGQPE